jgi:hypothetical protein
MSFNWKIRWKQSCFISFSMSPPEMTLNTSLTSFTDFLFMARRILVHFRELLNLTFGNLSIWGHLGKNNEHTFCTCLPDGHSFCFGEQGTKCIHQ